MVQVRGEEASLAPDNAKRSLWDLHGHLLCQGHSPRSDFSQQSPEACSPVQSTKWQCLCKKPVLPQLSPTRGSLSGTLPARTDSWDGLPLQAFLTSPGVLLG